MSLFYIIAATPVMLWILEIANLVLPFINKTIDSLLFLAGSGFFRMATIGTINEEGQNVDLYIPRKCHATNRLIESHDHGAIQISVAEIDAHGVATGNTKTFCLAGFLRDQSESDHAINHLAVAHGIIRVKSGKKYKSKKFQSRVARKPTAKAPVKAAARGGKPAPKGARKPHPKGAKPSGERKPVGERKPAGEQKPGGERKPAGERRAPSDRKPAGERRVPAARKPRPTE